MNLYDKLNEGSILLPLKSLNKLEAIQELLYHLQNLDILSNTNKLFNSIVKKEETLPSAAGRGIAYPNFISTEIDGLVCVLGISREGLDFDSPDGQLCHLILLTLGKVYLVKTGQNFEHSPFLHFTKSKLPFTTLIFIQKSI